MLVIKRAVAPAATSVGSTIVSFFVQSLPFVQWLSAAVAVVSGVLAIVWVLVQIHDRFATREEG